MNKLTTLLIAGAFSAPVFAADVTDFGIGIDNGHRLSTAPAAGDSLVLEARTPGRDHRHVADFGVGIDEGYDANRSERSQDVMLSHDAAPVRDSVVDFGVGIDEGYGA